MKTLAAEIRSLDNELEALARLAAPSTSALFGVAVMHTATLLIPARTEHRTFSSEAAFANLCAAAPIEPSSGKTTRRHLNYSGNRDANKTFHRIAVVGLRYCEHTKQYMAAPTAEGKSKPEETRNLKRYIALNTYRALRADLATLNTRLDDL